jgi:hypothetical protein
MTAKLDVIASGIPAPASQICWEQHFLIVDFHRNAIEAKKWISGILVRVCANQ